MTEYKVKQLKESFPEADEDALFEVLLSCEGSMKAAENVLLESFPHGPERKRYRPGERQLNIKRLLGVTDDSALISRNTTGANRPVYLYTKEDLEQTVPYATIHHNFLPPDIADDILRHTMNDKHGFSKAEFYLFGKKCVSNHESKLYASGQMDGIYYNGKLGHWDPDHSIYTEAMKIAKNLIEKKVNELNSQRERLPFEPVCSWKGDMAVCNRFFAKSNDLDWHSDRLTYIGPHCTIASLTLGATREFRIRKGYHDDTDAKFNTIYAVPIPHNTLLLMHAGFQEEFRHCVSSTTEIIPHPISGPLRINLTYRHYLGSYKENLPLCDKCGHQMDLRRSYKSPEVRGRYIWRCTGSYQNKECSRSYFADFSSNKLYTLDPEKCSVWIARGDTAALNCFREEIAERLKARDSKLKTG